MTKFCPKCGKEAAEQVKFCSGCGNPFPAPQQPEKPVQAASAAQTALQKAAQLSGFTREVQADAAAGTAVFELNGGTAAAEQADAVLGTFRTLAEGFRGLFRRIVSLKGNRRALIATAILTAVWVIVWLWNRSGLANGLSAFLSALTFAEGGTRGTAAQFVGGICGKGLVMTGFVSLFSGGFKPLLRGFRGMLRKETVLGALIAGLGASMLCYQLFAGYAGSYGMAVAISGAVLSLQALGGKTGFLRRLTASLTAKKTDKGRTEHTAGLRSLLTGLTAGFALSAALSARYIPWWIPACIVAAGIIIGVVLKRKGASS